MSIQNQVNPSSFTYRICPDLADSGQIKKKSIFKAPPTFRNPLLHHEQVPSHAVVK